MARDTAASATGTPVTAGRLAAAGAWLGCILRRFMPGGMTIRVKCDHPSQGDLSLLLTCKVEVQVEILNPWTELPGHSLPQKDAVKTHRPGHEIVTPELTRSEIVSPGLTRSEIVSQAGEIDPALFIHLLTTDNFLPLLVLNGTSGDCHVSCAVKRVKLVLSASPPSRTDSGPPVISVPVAEHDRMYGWIRPKR